MSSMGNWWSRSWAVAQTYFGRAHIELPSTSGVSGGELDTPTANVVDPGPEVVSEQLTAEEVWRALKATQRNSWEFHPRVEDMVREVERMTGVAAEDVAVAQLLDMAGYLTRSPPPPNLVRIAQLVLEDSGEPLPQLSRDGSLYWDPQVPPWLIVAVVCVHLTLELAARRTAAHAVTVGAPLNNSSVRALGLALVVLSAQDSYDRTQVGRLKRFLFHWGWCWLLDDPAAEEVEVFYTALNLNRSITRLELPILLKQAGPGDPWGLDCRHVHHMLSANSTLESLTLCGKYGHDGAGAGFRLDEGGVDVDAPSAAPTSPQLLSTLAASWTNATLDEFLFMCEEETGRLVQMDEAFEMIAHLPALRMITIRQGRSTDSPFNTTMDAVSYYLPTCVAWSEDCLGLLKHVLTTTSSLTHFSLLLQAPAAVVDCFSHNRGTLKKLELSLDVYGREAMFRLLTPGPPGATTPHAIANSLKHLNLFDMCPRRHSSIVECKSCELRRSCNVECVEKEVEEEVNALAAMIVNNTSLVRLLLYDAKYSPRQWATIIFPALAQNNTLEDLEVIECTGVDARHGVAEAALSMLQHNTTLRRIELDGTPLQAQGKGAAIQLQLQRNIEYRAALAGLPTMSVRSCRLILCGYPLAGKSTMCEAICKSAASIAGHKVISQRSTTPAQTQQGATVNANACEPTQEEVTASRTHKGFTKVLKASRRLHEGFEVKLLQDENDMQINEWDFSGQQHYYGLHDFVFPSINSSSIFLIVYSPVLHRDDPSNNTRQFQLKDSRDFQMELIYSLKFIASRLRPRQPSKPVVLVAITFMDVFSRVAKMKEDQLIEELIDGFVKLKSDFQQYVEMQGEKPLFLDARCSADASRVLLLVKESLSKIVRCLPEVPRVCERVRRQLQQWCLARPNQPIMTIEEFEEVFQRCRLQHDGNMAPRADAGLLEDRFFAHNNSWQVAAFYFAYNGEIIYFRNMDFIVVSPHWLGQGVLGEMIDTFTPGCCSSSATNMLEKLGDKGFLEKDAWEKLLEASLDEVEQQKRAVNARQFSQLMVNLHLCYESRNFWRVLEGYFVPVLLEIHGSHDGLDDKQRAWLSQTLAKNLEKCFFTGLRLQCADHACTFLTPGFFPRLQVMLYNHYLENGFIGPGKQETRVEIDVEMFAVTTRGLDILVEYSGSLGFYVDIMVKSIKHPLQTMEFVHQHVVKPIRLFCASQEGCMGVDLEEHMLSQECVKHLTVRRDRSNQSVRTVDLMSGVKKAQAQGDSYIHTWPKVAEGGINLQEYATIINGHVILGSETDMTWASSPRAQQALDDCYLDRYPDINVKTGKRRGVAVLISMEHYKACKCRYGSQVDRGRQEALANGLKLDYDGNNFLNCDVDFVRKELLHLAQTRILPDDECLVCFVNAHGDRGKDGAVFFTDCNGSWISLSRDVMEPFRTCENLVGKPKIFFVNACRRGLTLQSMDDPVGGLGAGEEQPIPSSWSDVAELGYVEQVADCLVVFSASQCAASPRDWDYGTNFTYALLRAVNKYRDSRDLMSILSLLTDNLVHMKNEHEDEFFAVFNSSLRKLVYWRSG